MVCFVVPVRAKGAIRSMDGEATPEILALYAILSPSPPLQERNQQYLRLVRLAANPGRAGPTTVITAGVPQHPAQCLSVVAPQKRRSGKCTGPVPQVGLSAAARQMAKNAQAADLIAVTTEIPLAFRRGNG
jgi:hypothetical protein